MFFCSIDIDCNCSMSQGVQACSVMVCFLTPAYQNSANCKRELTYALRHGRAIIPCMVGSKEQGGNWKASDWLGMSIADILYLDFCQGGKSGSWWILGSMRIHQDPSGSIRIQQDPPESIKIHQDPSGSTRIHQDPRGSSRIHSERTTF
jgi:hypothetical protein